MVPLYPREKCALFKPNDETERRGPAPPRRVVLTASPGEALIGSSSVRFVIDVGVERRKVSRTQQLGTVESQFLGFLPFLDQRVRMRAEGCCSLRGRECPLPLVAPSWSGHNEGIEAPAEGHS